MPVRRLESGSLPKTMFGTRRLRYVILQAHAGDSV